MKYLYLSICLLFSCFSLHGQNREIDSLKTVLVESADTVKVNVLNRLCQSLAYIDPVDAEKYGQQAIRAADELGYQKGLAVAHKAVGDCFLFRSEFAKALEYFDSTKFIIENSSISNSQPLYMSVYNSIGNTHYRQGNYQDALAYLLKSLAIAEVAGEKLIVGKILNNIGLIHMDQDEQDDALAYFFKSLKIAQNVSHKELLGHVTNNIGLVYRDKERYDEAIHYFLMSIETKESTHNNFGSSISLTNLAEIYKRLKDYPAALAYLEEAEKIKLMLDDKSGLVMVKDIRSEILLLQGKISEAERLINENYSVVLEIGGENVPFIYDRYYQLYSLKKDYKKALHWYAKKSEFNDSIFNERKSKQLAELRTLYEVNKKEKEILKLEKENEEAQFSKRIIMISSVSVFVLMVTIGWFIAYRMRKKNQLHAMEIELTKKKIENARLHQEELEREIEFKNKELASYTINFVQKSEMMEELKRNLQTIVPQNTEVAKKIANINKIVESSYQVDREWEDFKMQFENVHSNFFQMLKDRCPELTNGDLKLCALLKLNMNMKEAAKVLGISPESVKTARYRLRKKFELAQDDNLVDFILSIEKETKSDLSFSEVPVSLHQ
jgi:tetratricopeptide (TPR) repeat protein/DNA-binding CsgD family transcriptional regulator